MGSQMVQLGYESAPVFDAQAIATRAEEILGSGIELASDGPMIFWHMDHTVSYQDKKDVPGQTVLLPAPDGQPTEVSFDEAIQQSWKCDDAADRVAACSSFPMLTEMLTRALEAGDRLKLFHGVLQAVAELTTPTALIFQHSQQVIAPRDYLATCNEPPEVRAGSINIRFFNISNSDTNDMLMDTRGLHEIGLNDLQCHYRDIQPSDVAQVLFNTACYTVEQGPVIESGHTIEGHAPENPWHCQFQDAMVNPERVVLDLDPGPPFAAGNREEPVEDSEAAE